MKIATAGSRLSKRWRTTEVTWEWLVDKLREVRRTGESMAEYHRMSKDEQSSRKDVGGFVGGALDGGRRISTAVKERWLITLDADYHANLDDAEDFYSLYGCAMAMYSTHSSTPDALRLRYVIPLSRAVSVEEYQALARKVASLIGMDTMDPTTFAPERLFYWPSCPDDAQPIFKVWQGEALDADEMLSEYGEGESWRDVSLWPMASRETEIVRREAKKQGDPTTKPGIVGKFCRAYDVTEAIDAFLSDVYEECTAVASGKPRYTYINGSSSGGAVVEDDGKFIYSHHATDPAGGQLCNAFDLVRIHKFGDMDDGQENQEVTRRPSYKAMCEFASADSRVRQTDYEARMAQCAADFADIGDIADMDCGERVSRNYTDECKNQDVEWVSRLKRNTKTGEAYSSIENAKLIMNNDPHLKGMVAMNKFTGRMVTRRKLPWREREFVAGEDMWTDADEANLFLYLEKYWGLSGKDKILNALTIVAQDNAFHPVVEYLDELTWDGVPRLDDMLIRWMGAEDNAYVRAVTRKWMCAGVARTYNPGCKFDHMLMLVGPQGAGKSKLVYALTKGRWYTDSLNNTEGKEAYTGLRGKWLIEFAELSATKKSAVESVKNFITKQEDSYRPAYGRNIAVFPRQCIFYGTTNDREFLRDRTGNRRFWPVEIVGIDNGRLTGLDAEVDQLWAEAKYRYSEGEPLWLDDAELQRLAQEQQERFTEQDELVGVIEEYLDRLVPDNWESLSKEMRRDYIQGGTASLAEGTKLREFVCLMEIRYELLGQDVSEIVKGNNIDTRRLASIMNNMPGWKHAGRRMFSGYGQQRYYERVID